MKMFFNSGCCSNFVSTAISTAKSAEASKEKISGLMEQLKVLKSRSEELGNADETTKANIEKKYTQIGYKRQWQYLLIRSLLLLDHQAEESKLR